MTHAIEVLNAVPADDRTAKIDYALGMSYDQLKQNKNAIDAYTKAFDMEPDNLDAERGLAQALLNDNQLSAALKHFEAISAADPQDAQTYLRIAEIQRRDGHYEQALTTLKKAKALASDSLEIGFNEALIDDSLGHYDEAAQALQLLVKQTTHADGQYADAEKNNRSIFLDRLALVYREQNKTDQAVQTYQLMVAMGGEYAERGYQGQVDAYRDAKQYDKATQVAQQAAAAMPKDKSVQLMLAGQIWPTPARRTRASSWPKRNFAATRVTAKSIWHWRRSIPACGAGRKRATRSMRRKLFPLSRTTRSISTFCAEHWTSGRSTTIPPRSNSARFWLSTPTTA